MKTMKALLLDYASYHIWANEQFYKLLRGLDEVTLNASVSSSFPSLFGTILHMWDAEAIWWQRIQGKSPILVPSKGFQELPVKGMEALLMQGHLWKEWIESKSEEELAVSFSYTNLKGQPFESPILHLLLHLYNHGTYHRGQLVTILHQLGHTKIPATDFIVWSRSVGK
jgi:uncharacterized damage-inducible protein DinB